MSDSVVFPATNQLEVYRDSDGVFIAEMMPYEDDPVIVEITLDRITGVIQALQKFLDEIYTERANG